MKTQLKIWKDIIFLKDEPKIIARGFALGSFIGMLPIPGFQMMLSLAIASLFKLNKKAACLAVFNTNMATGAFIFSFNYWLGKKILGVNPAFIIGDSVDFRFVQTILRAGSDVYLSLVVGGVLTGLVFSLIVYYILMSYLARRTC